MLIDILLAFAVVALVALIAGVLLALAAHFLSVKEDETVQKVRECLPGVNCGACGYTGCDEYAKAVALEGAKTNLCIPGADSVAAAVAGVMGVESEDVLEMIAYVHCNGNCDATTNKANYDGIQTCAAASMVYGGPAACRYGCLGCGDCASVCPNEAICVTNGVAYVIPERCIGCGLCVRACPKKIIELIPQTAKIGIACSNTDKGAVARKVCKNACIGCKKCELHCKSEAIKVENNLARIDYEKCIDCGVCEENCPTHCIKRIADSK